MSFYIDRKAGPQRAGVLASLGLVAKCFRLLPEKNQTEPHLECPLMGQEGPQGMDLHYIASARA